MTGPKDGPAGLGDDGAAFVGGRVPLSSPIDGARTTSLAFIFEAATGVVGADG